MDHTETHTRYQRSNSEHLEVNAKLFHVIRKREIPSPQKVKKIRKLLGKNLNQISIHKMVMIIGTLLCTW